MVLLKYVVGSVPLANAGDGFGPGQSGPFTIGVKGSFAPRVQAVKALLGLTCGARVLSMHVDTESTTIDLRSAQPHQFQERWLQVPRFAHIPFQRGHRPI